MEGFEKAEEVGLQNRLDHALIGARLERRLTVHSVTAAGRDDDLSAGELFGFGAQKAAELEAGIKRGQQIAEDEGGLFLQGQGQTRGPFVRFEHIPTRLAQPLRQRVAGDTILVDQQSALHPSMPPSSSLAPNNTTSNPPETADGIAASPTFPR